MPRIRSIKPELPSDRKLASVSREARYTFVLLISQADDDGLLRAEPRQLLGSLYPYDEDVTSDRLEAWLAELEGRGFIRFRQTREGVRVIEVVKFSRHQVIKNPSKSFIAHELLPPSQESVTPLDTECNSSGQAVGEECGGAESRVQSPESRVPTTAHRVGDPYAYSPAFEQAWSAYPKRPNNSKAHAWRAWQARVKAGEQPERMLDGTYHYAAFVAQEKTEPRFIKQAATFFGPDRHYLNDFATGPPAAPDVPEVPEPEWITAPARDPTDAYSR